MYTHYMNILSYIYTRIYIHTYIYIWHTHRGGGFIQSPPTNLHKRKRVRVVNSGHLDAPTHPREGKSFIRNCVSFESTTLSFLVTKKNEQERALFGTVLLLKVPHYPLFLLTKNKKERALLGTVLLSKVPDYPYFSNNTHIVFETHLKTLSSPPWDPMIRLLRLLLLLLLLLLSPSPVDVHNIIGHGPK